ncbi:hypothetical protein [Cellulomonas soli]|uniref:Uncharacterized protein n=1 Tax=Cellulomonas soli TaxID=931535 RepID=A0A512PIS0_9CELL|nr:hypothetical protein [Cellulomonas soli]NYI58244.1 hypothetical protein [Cellulomonas soli]GEP71108.1 hypothetical protein CSO01_38230 [Cellulomonas soli]
MNTAQRAAAFIGICVAGGVLVGGGLSLALHSAFREGGRGDTVLETASKELRSPQTSAQMLTDRLAAIDGVDPSIESAGGSTQFVPVIDSPQWPAVFDEVVAICQGSGDLWTHFGAEPPVCVIATSTVTVESGWPFISGRAAVDLATELAADPSVRAVSVGMGDDGQGRVLVTVDETQDVDTFRAEHATLVGRYAKTSMALLVQPQLPG